MVRNKFTVDKNPDFAVAWLNLASKLFPRGHYRSRPETLKILVFLQGTIVVERNLLALTRVEMVKRSREREKYGGVSGQLVPLGNSAYKLKRWKEHGAEIAYFSATRKPERLTQTKETLRANGFPEGEVLCRGLAESYAEAAQRINPDIIVEDDCESIGGEMEMMYPHMEPSFKSRIVSVVVKEFEGLDQLPDDPNQFERT